MTTIEGIKRCCALALPGTSALKAFVFGSYAKGSQTRRSDIDLMVIDQTDKAFFRRFEEFSALYDAFENEVIDLLIYTPKEIEEMSHRRFIRTILSDGVVVYER
jgi:predicted nucleotidyltransferase